MLKRLLIVGLFGMAVWGQAPGVIARTVVATAPAGTPIATQIVCTFSAPAKPAIHMVCTYGGTVMLTLDVTVAVGVANALVGSLPLGGNNITWKIQQLTAGVVSWEVVANGVSDTGVF